MDNYRSVIDPIVAHTGPNRSPPSKLNASNAEAQSINSRHQLRPASCAEAAVSISIHYSDQALKSLPSLTPILSLCKLCHSKYYPFVIVRFGHGYTRMAPKGYSGGYPTRLNLNGRIPRKGARRVHPATNQTQERTTDFEHNDQSKTNHKVFCSKNSMHLQIPIGS